MLIRSMSKVLGQHPGIGLLIVGVGPLNRGLEKLAAELGVSEQIILAGKVSYADLPVYHNTANVFAVPARTRGCGLSVEGLGIVYSETQACSVPVATGRSGDAPETAIGGETDIAADGASKRSIITGLIEILDDPERAATTGACGREYTAQSWTWKVMAARARQILQTCTIPL